MHCQQRHEQTHEKKPDVTFWSLAAEGAPKHFASAGFAYMNLAQDRCIGGDASGSKGQDGR